MNIVYMKDGREKRKEIVNERQSRWMWRMVNELNKMEERRVATTME